MSPSGSFLIKILNKNRVSKQAKSDILLINILDFSSLGNGGRVSVRGVFSPHQDVLLSHPSYYIVHYTSLGHLSQKLGVGLVLKFGTAIDF